MIYNSFIPTWLGGHFGLKCGLDDHTDCVHDLVDPDITQLVNELVDGEDCGCTTQKTVEQLLTELLS